jgi:hypothetical protein
MYTGLVTLGPVLRLLAAAMALTACAELMPLREPPPMATDDPMRDVTTREQALERLGPPAEIRAADTGEVLVYRRTRVIDVNPNRYYGGLSRERANQHELLLVHVDPDGRIVRWSVERE